MSTKSTMNVDTDAYRAQYVAMVQPLVEQPVIAVGLVSRRGALRDTVVGKLSPATYWALRSRAKRKAPGLPSSVMLAVTATHVYVFAHAFKHGATVVTGEVARWPRADMSVAADQNRTCDFLAIAVADGTVFEFESMRGYDFNHALFDCLLSEAARHP
jgi:hypothetical protein